MTSINLFFTVFVFFVFSPLTALAQLDAESEKSYQAVLNRYRNGSEAPRPGDDETATLPTKESPRVTPSSTISTSIDSVNWSSSENIYWETQSEDDVVRVTRVHEIWAELQSGGYNYGNSLQQSFYSKVTKESGDHLIISSSLSSKMSTPSRNNSLNAQIHTERKFENSRIVYLGNINLQGGFYSNIDSSVGVIHTVDFDPCLLEESAFTTLQNQQEIFYAQGRLDFNVNCMITKNLEGGLSVGFIFTTKEGELLKQIKLSGNLALNVSSALSIKYSVDYISGQNPLGENNFEMFSTGPSSGQEGFDFNMDYLSIGDLFFTKKEHSQGLRQQISIEQTSSPSENCTNKTSLLFGHESTSLSSEPIYSIALSNLCRLPATEDSEEKNVTTSFSLGNLYSFQDGSPAPNLHFSHSVTSGLSSTSLDVLVVLDSDQQNIYEFNLNSSQTSLRGDRSKSSLRLVHLSNESYVVVEQVFISPILNTGNLLTLQTPQGSRNPEEGPTSQALTTLTDPQLCRVIDCFELGAGLTFTNQGGVFLTAKGKTIADVFGREFQVEIIAGLPLNDLGENRSWGQVRSFGFAPSSSDRGSPFWELRLSPNDCNPSDLEFCSEFKFRQETNSTSFGFGTVLKF